MRIGYITSSTRGLADRVIAEATARLTERGLRLAGLVQTDLHRPGRRRCDMLVRVLPQGPTIPISQDLGDGARGCRLDPDALERAVALVAAEVERDRCEAVILNKFGKHEAEGRGFRGVIAVALERGLPVFLGVGDPNRSAFLAFCGEIAEELPCDARAVADWIEARLPVYA